MTHTHDLQAAIDEIKRVTKGKWREADIEIAAMWPTVERAIATILNAVVSGDLRPAPAVPDDVAETTKRLRDATFTKGRMRRGVIGQTVEAAMRATFHEVSAWDLETAADALEAQAAELTRLRAIQEACAPLADMDVWYRAAGDDDLMFVTVGTLRRIREAFQPTGERT